MIKPFLLFLIACSFSLCTWAQSTFQKKYGTPQIDVLTDMILTTDGGNLMTGFTVGSTNLNSGIYIVKTDGNGFVQWSNIYGDSMDRSFSLKAALDGGYITGGTTGDGNGNNRDLLLLKLDSTGNVQWSHSYSLIQDEVVSDVEVAPDGGYLVSGWSTLTTDPFATCFVLKTNATGTLLWCKYLPFSTFMMDTKCTINYNGNYVVYGNINSFTIPEYLFVAEISSAGNLLWYKIYNGGGAQAGDINYTADGGYIVTGSLYSGLQQQESFALKIDSAGTIQWSKSYNSCASSPSSKIVSTEQTNDLGFIFSGYEICAPFGTLVPFLIKTDNAGAMQWSRFYGNTGLDLHAIAAHQVFTDGTYTVGLVDPIGTINNYYLIKTDTNGLTGCFELTGNFTASSVSFTDSSVSVSLASGGNLHPFVINSTSILSDTIIYCLTTAINDIPLNQAKMLISPNPSVGNTVVRFGNVITEGTLVIYNTAGKTVFEENILNESKKEINLGNVSAGMYFVKLTFKDHTEFTKLSLVK